MVQIDLNQMRGSAILIVGASGFLGRHLVRALSCLDAEVFAVSRSCNPVQGSESKAAWWQCDASDQEQVATVFRKAQPSIVYHLTSASRGGSDLALIDDGIRNDILATTNVLCEAVRSGVRRVVMTGSLEEPIGSIRDAIPSSPYSTAKWASCAYARMIWALHNLPVTILRPMMTYGPGQKDYKVIPYTIRTLLTGQTAKLTSGDRMLDWVYVDDVINAFLLAGVAPLADARTIDIGTGELIRLQEVLSLLGQLIGRPELLAFGDLPNRAMEHNQAANPKDAVEKLGWHPVTPLREGLLRTIDAYRSIMT